MKLMKGLLLSTGLVSATYKFQNTLKFNTGSKAASTCDANVIEGSFDKFTQIENDEDEYHNEYNDTDGSGDTFDPSQPKYQISPKNGGSKMRVVFLLDATSSMEKIKHNIIDQYNNMLNNLRQEYQDEADSINFTLVRFAQMMKVTNYASLNDVPELDQDSYPTVGKTALYDAVGCTLQAFQDEPKNVVQIFTDGNDSYSKIYKDDRVKNLVKTLSGKEWQINYTGTGHDVPKAAKSIGIKPSNRVQFRKNQRGLKNGFAKSSRRLNSQIRAAMKYHKEQNRRARKAMSRSANRRPPAGFGDY